MNNIAISSIQTNPTQMPPQNSLNITQPIQPPNMHPQASSNNGKLTISNLNPQQSLITHTDPQNARNSHKNDTNQHHANPPTPTNNNMSMSGGSIVNDNLLQQLEMKSQMHHIPIPSMGGKPSIMGLMPNYEDPVEQSLASLEQQPMLKNDIDGIQNHMDLMNDMSSIISKQEGGVGGPNMPSHQSLMMPHLAYDGMQQHSHGGNNGFGIDPSSLAMNGMNMGAMVGNHLSMLGMPPMGLNSMSQPNPATSIFDPLPQGVHRSNSSSVSSMSITQTSSVNIRKEEKFLLTPKPIEELMNPSHDKKTTSPIDGKSAAGFVHAINKLDHNLKNASSWSSLAAAGSPQNPLTSSKSKPPAMDSFQQFRNKAKEKMDRQKMLEQQELRRTQKEAAEKQRNQEQQKHVKQREEVEVPAR